MHFWRCSETAINYLQIGRQAILERRETPRQTEKFNISQYVIIKFQLLAAAPQMYIYLGTLRSNSQNLGIVESFANPWFESRERRGGHHLSGLKNRSKVWECCRPGSCCLVVSCDSALSQVQAGRSYFTSKEEIILWKLDIFFLPSPLFHASVPLCLTSRSIALEFIFLALSRVGIPWPHFIL